MKRIAITAFAVCLSLGPAVAQGVENNPLRIEQGAKQFLQDLLREMEPAWREMQGFMDEMGPAMMDLIGQIEDWSAYEPPEVLENGDIIIRRKDPEKRPFEKAPAPQIEL